MKLTDIDLGGLGKFGEAHASFTVNKHHLPTPWEYQYYNGEAILRLRQDGGIFFQKSPPGGAIILNQERMTAAPSMFVWIIPQEQRERTAFTNFRKPVLPYSKPGSEPKVYRCTFEPEVAHYHLEHGDFTVDTEIMLPMGQIAAVMSLSIQNTGSARRIVTLMPVVRPYLASTAMKPWDKPAWYQTCAMTRAKDYDGFWLEMRDAHGNPANRMSAGIVSNFKPTSFEVVQERFVGAGQWDSPQAVWDGKLAKLVDGKIPPYGQVSEQNAAVGQPSVAAMARDIELDPGQSFEFTIGMGMLHRPEIGQLPPESELAKLSRHFDPAQRKSDLVTLKNYYNKLFNHRRLQTPDEALNRYVNEFLALQLWQVQVRGHGPMRGVRDTAQDVTGFVGVDPQKARRRILEILDSQRSDGWFLRQYNTLSKAGPHDERAYVDSGLWVFELIWEYLVYTRDFALLDERVAWLDRQSTDSVLDHMIRIFDYYLDEQNIGEHGLCKIREGDWNDSVNAAGREGRGETVMVSAHAVYCLMLAADLLHTLSQKNPKAEALLKQAERFEKAAQTFKANMLKHALNSEGYFNGVFNDAGKWLFSPKDPDGAYRINSTPNTFAIIAGVVEGKARDKVFKVMDRLKGPYGWRLFHPPVSGNPPIPKMGRIGQGDKAPGLGENGCPYNHGSHGFLARAAWSAGKGDFFYQVMRYMFPYDQEAHPVKTTQSAPFAIVNNYLEAIGLEGRGGAPYVTGSTPVAARNAFDGFLGFRPNLHHLVIDPVIPAAWESSGGTAQFLGGIFNIAIHNPGHVQAGVKKIEMDGKEIGERYMDNILGREVIGIPIESLRPGVNHNIVVMMG